MFLEQITEYLFCSLLGLFFFPEKAEQLGCLVFVFFKIFAQQGMLSSCSPPIKTNPTAVKILEPATVIKVLLSHPTQFPRNSFIFEKKHIIQVINMEMSEISSQELIS